MDSYTYARGLEEYLPKKAKRNPIYFYKKPVLNEVRSKQLKDEAVARGESPDSVSPVFEDVIYAKIPQTGSKRDCFDNPVTDAIRDEYAREYEMFVSGLTNETGTPLDAWAGLPEEIKLMLQMFNIFTLEQFISMPTSMYSQVGPETSKFIAEAKHFLGKQYATSRKEEEEKKETRIKELEEKLERLMLASSTEETKRKR